MMDLKRNNRSAVLRLLLEKGSMSRKRLAESTGLTPAAITKIAAELISEGVLREGGSVASGNAGRREILLELNSRCVCSLGVLINLGQAIVSAVWLDGTEVFAEEIRIEHSAPAGPTVSLLADRVMALAKDNGIERNRISGIGVAVRGITSADGEFAVNSFGALREKNYPLRRSFEEATGIRAILSNNVRALFAAQMFQTREQASLSQFFLRCEYGIGASLSVDGKIWHGATQQCSEIGHIPVVRSGGKLCSCGKTGCLETVASPTAIIADALSILSPQNTPVLWSIAENRSGPDSITLDDVLMAACNGDSAVLAIVDNAVLALGSAVKAVIYMFDPEKIVLYGRMFDNRYYLSRFMSEVRIGVDSGHNVLIEKSRFNHLLENKAASLLAVTDYYDRGGIL